MDGEIAAVARGQHGLITVEQLTRIGVGRAAVRHRLAAARWGWAARRVVRVEGAPVTWESRLLAHVLSAGPGAVASHRSAAVLWGLDGAPSGVLELSVPRRRWYRLPGVHCHRSTDLDRVETVLRRSIPTTPAARTLLELGAVVGRRLVHVAIDSARRRRLTTWDSLLDTLVLHSRRGRDGAGTLRAILDEHFAETAITDSAFERLVLSLLTGAGLPRPTLQHEIEVAGQRYRLDLAYPDARLAIELDGRTVVSASSPRSAWLSRRNWVIPGRYPAGLVG